MGYLTCAVVLLLLFLGWTLAFPSNSPKKFECVSDEVQTLCQRCAKATKSKIVYPMCCEDLEEARNWCYHYVTFGIQGQK